MSKDTYRDLLSRFDQIRSDRTTVQTMWDAIERFITPYRGRMFHDQRSEHSIEWFRSRDIYDSTAVMAHKNLSASIHGSLTSPTMRWFDLRFRDKRLNNSNQANGWLQGVADGIHYELQDSNFDLEINKTYQDLVGYGTAVMVLEENPGEGWTGLNFTSVPVKESFFECDSNDQVLRYYRLLEWTPQQIIHRFGTKVPQSILDREEHKNTEKVQVLYCIYPRNNRIMKWGEKVAPSRRPWAGVYLLKDGGEKLGDEVGYYEMPAFVCRWDTVNSSQWGNSPSMNALGDVLTLNEVVKQDLRAKAKQIDPPMLVEERAVISDLNLDPATISVVRNTDGLKEAPGPQGMSITASDVTIARLQNAIRNYFMVDRIDFPDMQPQPMTATEAQIRYERMQRYLGATLAHLRNDLLNPIVERAFNMMVREGQVAEAPELVADAGNIDIIYLGALTRAQQVDEVAAIERTMMSAATVAEVYPDALDVVDAPAAIAQIAQKLNAPAEMIRDKAEVKQIQDQRRAQQAVRESAETAQMTGDAAASLAAGEEAIGA